MAIMIRQGLGYGAVGGIQIALDWLIFVGLTTVGVPTVGANLVGRVIAAMLGFWLNGKWTFASREGTPLGFGHLGRYLVSWSFMTLLSTVAVLIAARTEGLHAAWAIKPGADLILAAMGFTVSKYWIYR